MASHIRHDDFTLPRCVHYILEPDAQQGREIASGQTLRRCDGVKVRWQVCFTGPLSRSRQPRVQFRRRIELHGTPEGCLRSGEISAARQNVPDLRVRRRIGWIDFGGAPQVNKRRIVVSPTPFDGG
jgi:hypothetical protein